MSTQVRLTPREYKSTTNPDLVWYDAQPLGVEGKGWTNTVSYYERLPAHAAGKVREPVWDLSHDSAGMIVRFATDALKIAARYTLRRSVLAMPHMPATGVSGLDLYAKDEAGAWRWVGVGRPEAFPTVEAVLRDGLTPGRREYLLFLPLYNGVAELSIGVPGQAAFQPLGPRPAKPIVFYGTSIVQGGCASRPGMCHPAIIGRWLDWPVINLGFSGNGIMEPEVADLLAELDPAAYVLDALPNMNPAGITERAGVFIRKLRDAHPKTPIVLVEDRTYCASWITPALEQANAGNRAAFSAVYRSLRKAGVGGLTYVKGEKLLGHDDEGTVDASHPTDLGFLRMAERLTPVLRRILP